LTEPDDNQYYEDAGLFYAALMSDRTLSLTLPGENGDATYNYYQLVAENGWYSAESNYTFYLGNFEIFDITESDRWGLQRLIPEPSTATLSLLALAALAARRRRRASL
jgi:MYXO-CTERM domain-containing protein